MLYLKNWHLISNDLEAVFERCVSDASRCIYSTNIYAVNTWIKNTHLKQDASNIAEETKFTKSKEF